MGLFGKSTFLGEDLEEWCLDTWAWFMRNLGGMDRSSSMPLITPSRDFFPPSDATGHERALHVFGCVKHLMGMDNWSCTLEPYDRREANAQVGDFWFLRGGSAPNGTFQVSDGEVLIRYASDLIDRPSDLVGTLAHELCHYLLATIQEPNPGGPEVHELDTDLAVAFCGFGAFGANRAFSFEQHGDAFGQGWKSQRNGYLSEKSWSFALALFLALKNDPDDQKKWLKPGIVTEVAKARRYLNRNGQILDTLKAIA